MTIHCRASGSGTATAVGTLIIGDANSQTGFNFDGAPAVGTNQVVLADSNPADLGSAPTIGLGSQLNSLNGIRIAANRAIATSERISATIGSKLTDNGTDGGPTLAGHFLSLTSDVTGTGDFGG